MSETAVAPSSPFRPTLFHIALLVPWIAIVIKSFHLITDNSYLWHIRAGELQLAGGRVLTSDPFSFTVIGEGWRTQSWLVELGYGWLESLYGLAFTAPMMLAVSTLCFVAIGAVAYRSSKSLPAMALVVVLSAIIVPRFLVPRPALFGYLLFVLIVLAWERKSQRWLIPLLFWLWASIHGSFLIGLLYVSLRVVQRRDWSGVSPVLVSAGATLLTAHGFGVTEMVVSFVEAREYLGLMQEWRTPDLLQPDLIPFVLGMVLILYGATRGRVVPSDLWIVVPFLFLALSSERSVGLAWIAVLPILARATVPVSVRVMRGFSVPMAVAFVLAIGVLPFFLAESGELDVRRFPVAAAGHLEEVNTFHGDATGGYLIWSEASRVFIDDRVELYGLRMEEFVEVRSGYRDWKPLFERDGISQALLERGEPLIADLQQDGWFERYADDNFVVLAEQ
jgi:hypothetical protein